MTNHLRKLSKWLKHVATKDFVQPSFLHFTLLGLINNERKRPHPPDEIGEIIKGVKEFIEQKHLGHLIIKFNLVRPSAFYKDGRFHE